MTVSVDAIPSFLIGLDTAFSITEAIAEQTSLLA